MPRRAFRSAWKSWSVSGRARITARSFATRRRRTHSKRWGRLARTELDRQLTAKPHTNAAAGGRADAGARRSRSPYEGCRSLDECLKRGIVSHRFTPTTTAPSTLSIGSPGRLDISTGRPNRARFARSPARRRLRWRPVPTRPRGRLPGRPHSLATSCAIPWGSQPGRRSTPRAGRFASTPRAATSIRPRPTSIAGPTPGLLDQAAVYHYAADRHELEQRASCDHGPWTAEDDAPDEWLIALTSIHWRESWKYGERAFRYCQHDMGHAIAAVALGAALSGCRARLLADWSHEDIATLTGIDRDQNFVEAEREEAGCGDSHQSPVSQSSVASHQSPVVGRPPSIASRCWTPCVTVGGRGRRVS